jgi:cob(I)alamin adenosyltransferase
MSPIYFTAKGDDGYTGLLGEGRVAKDDTRIEAVGAVDEAGAAIGVARSAARSDETRALLLRIQRDLYGLMAELAATPENAERFRVIGAEQVSWLEAQIEQIGSQEEMPKEFIVPGDTPQGAWMDMARVVVRRAERHTASLFHANGIDNRELLRYLNRLSSLIFLLELRENRLAGNDNITFAKVD